MVRLAKQQLFLSELFVHRQLIIRGIQLFLPIQPMLNQSLRILIHHVHLHLPIILPFSFSSPSSYFKSRKWVNKWEKIEVCLVNHKYCGFRMLLTPTLKPKPQTSAKFLKNKQTKKQDDQILENIKTSWN